MFGRLVQHLIDGTSKSLLGMTQTIKAKSYLDIFRLKIDKYLL